MGTLVVRMVGFVVRQGIAIDFDKDPVSKRNHAYEHDLQTKRFNDDDSAVLRTYPPVAALAHAPRHLPLGGFVLPSSHSITAVFAAASCNRVLLLQVPHTVRGAGQAEGPASDAPALHG